MEYNSYRDVLSYCVIFLHLIFFYLAAVFVLLFVLISQEEWLHREVKVLEKLVVTPRYDANTTSAIEHQVTLFTRARIFRCRILHRGTVCRKEKC